jgi:hypothetical protein
VHAGAGLEVLVIAEVDQGVQAVDRLDPDVAARAAVAAVRPAVFDVLLPPERDGAAAPVAGPAIQIGRASCRERVS